MPNHDPGASTLPGRGPGEAFWPPPGDQRASRGFGLNPRESSFPPREGEVHLSPVGPEPPSTPSPPVDGGQHPEPANAGAGARHLRPQEEHHGRFGIQLFAALVIGVLVLVGVVVVVDRATRRRHSTASSGGATPTTSGSGPTVVTSTAPASSGPAGVPTTSPRTSVASSTSTTQAAERPLPWRLETATDGTSRLVVGDLGAVAPDTGVSVTSSGSGVPPVSGWYCITTAGALRQRSGLLAVGPSSTECHNRPGRIRQTTWVVRGADTGNGTQAGPLNTGEWSDGASGYAPGFTVPCTAGDQQVTYATAVAPEFDAGRLPALFAQGPRLRASCSAA